MILPKQLLMKKGCCDLMRQDAVFTCDNCGFGVVVFGVSFVSIVFSVDVCSLWVCVHCRYVVIVDMFEHVDIVDVWSLVSVFIVVVSNVITARKQKPLTPCVTVCIQGCLLYPACMFTLHTLHVVQFLQQDVSPDEMG